MFTLKYSIYKNDYLSESHNETSREYAPLLMLHCKIGLSDMKNKLISLFFLLFVCSSIHAQAFDTDKIAFTNFLVRMYSNAPFDGVRVVKDDTETSFLISVLALDISKYPSESVVNRVASVKAMAQASRFFNGSTITQDMVICTKEKTNGKSDVEVIEKIQENSIGYVKQLEQLTNFRRKDGKQVFIFITKVKKEKE